MQSFIAAVVLTVACMFSEPVFAQTVPVPVVPVIVFPDPPTPGPVPPSPAPGPNTAITLNAGVMYVIRSDKDCIVLCSPDGVLDIKTYAGPLLVVGNFVDGGQSDRKYTEKNIWIIRAARAGKCELIVIPVGGSATDVTRRAIMSSPTPTPPTPVPPAPVPPTPVPVPVDPLAKSLQAALDRDTVVDHANLGKLAALYSQAVSIANDPELTTIVQVHDKLKAARIALIGETLPNIRAAITAELDAVLPTTSATPLDAATRARITAEFTRLGQTIGGLK